MNSTGAMRIGGLQLTNPNFTQDVLDVDSLKAASFSLAAKQTVAKDKVVVTRLASDGERQSDGREQGRSV